MSKGKEKTPDMGLAGSVTDSAEKVERIRELIFGSHMRDYAQQFSTHTGDLAKLTQEVARLNTLLQEQEANFNRALRQEADRLVAQMQEQEKRTQQQIQQLDQRLTTQLKDLDQKHTQMTQELAGNLARTERALRDELHELSQQLNTMKVDRPTLGDLLIDLGSSLKSNEPTPLPVASDLLDLLSEELA
ncbi:MAG: hypothetical protein R3C14_28460 [Caldilineaceae bacterium]